MRFFRLVVKFLETKCFIKSGAGFGASVQGVKNEYLVGVTDSSSAESPTEIGYLLTLEEVINAWFFF